MSGIGLGNIQFKGIQSPATPPVPPFPAGAADNGLSVDPVTGLIVLGNDIGGVLATLLSDREIPFNSQAMRFTGMNGAGSFVSFQNAAGTISAVTPETMSGTNINGNQYFLRNIDGFLSLVGNSSLALTGAHIDLQDVFTGIFYDLDNTAGVLSITDGGAIKLAEFDAPGLKVSLGDILVTGAGTKLFLDDANLLANVETAAGSMLLLNQLTGLYQMGDVGIAANGLRFQLDDTNSFANVINTAGEYLSLDPANAIYKLGDISGAGNGLRLNLDDAVQQADITTSLIRGLKLDFVGGVYEMGDVDGVAGSIKLRINDTAGNAHLGDVDGNVNSTLFSLDDAAQTITATAANGFLTTDPGGGAGAWKLGKVTAGAIVVDAANYVEVDIDGSIVKLIKAA